MKDSDLMAQEFKELEVKIQKLKQVESELAELNTKGFEVEVQSLKAKLKKPDIADEAAKELSSLKKKMGATDVKVAAGASTLAIGKSSIKMKPGGNVFEDYEILEEIGVGGFSSVHRARRKSDGHIVAIKEPNVPKGITVPGKLFMEEAHLWSQLDHPNIVQVVDYGPKPTPWIAMEYMEGRSLRTKIGRLTLKESLDIALGIGDALFYSHHRGIIHMDIKPENVLFDKENNPKLSDWGTGKLMLELSPVMDTETTTLEYSSPEQVRPDKYGGVGWWTDIYQCGVVLYEMVTGQLPFRGKSRLELATMIMDGEVIKPSEVTPELPVELDEIIALCLAKDKKKRYQDISMLKAALESVKKPVD